jgi:tetratricopeptide (TPR) repeat protein
MCAMENSMPDETSPTPFKPEGEEIHGLEETQANPFLDSDRGALPPLPGSPLSPEPTEPEVGEKPSLEDTARTVRLSTESDELSTEDDLNADSTAQTVRVSTRGAVAEKEESEGKGPEIKTETPPPASRPVRRSRSRWLFVSLLGLLALAVVAVLSGLGGYFSGISMRQVAADTQAALSVKQQFDLGVQEFSEGNYFRARQRFEYVINLDPAYPGAVDMLANVLAELNTTATPTLVPTPTIAPTPDLRGIEELFNQAQGNLTNGEWSQAIDALLQLRKTDPEYHKVDVDGLLFVALRNRAKQKILNEADLEGGVYDLGLAQRFGVMDAEGQSLYNWSTYYITGASFWEIDWAQATYYFGQVAPYAPNLHDKSGMTAMERYRTALVRYASQLLNQKQFCKAQEQLDIALTILQDPEIQSAQAQAAQLCSGGPPPGGGEAPTETP